MESPASPAPSIPVLDEESLARGAVVSFSYVYEDYFLPTVPRRLGRRLIFIWTGTLLFLAGAWWAIKASGIEANDNSGVTKAAILIIFMIVLMSAYSYSRSQNEGRHRKQWEAQNIGHAYHMTVSTSGILWQTQYTRLEEQWPLYDHYQENEKGFWLYRAGMPDRPFLIPARSLSRQAVPILRELFRRHASGAKGFPVEINPSPLPTPSNPET